MIFGSRGGRPAYTEATLDYLHDEIAEAHDKAHHDSTYRPSQRSATQMALVQIEESELATLRSERNEARTKVDEQANDIRELTTKVETAEAGQKKATDEKAASDQKVKDLETAQEQAQLKDKRIGALGAGFMAKLGDTSKKVLNDLAAKADDETWEQAVAEREELAGVKRDAKADESASGSGGDGDKGGAGNGSPTFENEEVASFLKRNAAESNGGGQAVSGTSAVRSLARTFGNKRTPAGAGDKK